MSDELRHGALRVNLFFSPGHAAIIWSGVSDERNPTLALTAFFSRVKPSLAGRQVTMDFRPLSYMNSVTVGALISIVKTLDQSGIQTNLIYDNKSSVQRVSFMCMKNLAATMAHVTVVS